MAKSTLTFLLRGFWEDESVRKLKDYFSTKSFFEIIQQDLDENTHSCFLGWLFEDPETYSYAIERLLYLLVKRHSQQPGSHFPQNIEDALLVGKFKIISAKVILQDPISVGKIQAYNDILIIIDYEIDKKQGKLGIAIENKVSSDVHKTKSAGDKNQTQVYYDYYSEHGYKNDNKVVKDFIFVFLTPKVSTATLDSYKDPSRYNDKDKGHDHYTGCPEYILINYQDLLEYILVLLSEKEDISERKRIFIKEYIKVLSINSRNYIIAMDKKTKELLKEFLEANRDLIGRAIDMNADANPDDPDAQGLKDSFHNVTVRFKIEGEDKLYKMAEIINEVVKRYINNKKPKPDIDQLKKKFPKEWDNVGVVISKEEYDKYVNKDQDEDHKKRRQRRWRQVEGEDAYTTTQWESDSNHGKDIHNAINGINADPDIIDAVGGKVVEV